MVVNGIVGELNGIVISLNGKSKRHFFKAAMVGILKPRTVLNESDPNY